MKRTFKEYEAMWEDAAANSVGGGGVSMPADMMPKAAHKKHKKKVYDGRTKEGKAFVRRILDRRNKRMLKGQAEIDEGRYNSKTNTYEFDENDFRYYRNHELKLRNGAYGRDVEDAFKKAGYDIYGQDVSVRRDTIKFNDYSKKIGRDEKQLRKIVMDVLNIDINKL
jgi:hypothetical protein